jgi:hypothetical protein
MPPCGNGSVAAPRFAYLSGMTIQQLLSLVGPGFVIDPLHEKLREAAHKQGSLTPDTQRLVAGLLAQDPSLQVRLRQLGEDHLLKDEIIRGILEFIHRAGDPAARGRVRKLAAHFGVRLPAETSAPPGMEFLTASQQSAFHEICALTEIYFEQGEAGPSAGLRIAPLIIGPSGVGKSHLVTSVGRALSLPVIRVTVGDWIIRAARQSPCALEVLQDRLDRHERLILFIDELDKLRRSGDGSEYSLAQQVEIYSALDRMVSFPGATGKPWTDEHAEKLRRNVMIVGGGTWHDLWLEGARRPMGFGQAAAAEDDIATRIRQARIIPEELLNRFSNRWLLLRPYTIGDFQSIATRLSLAPEDFDPVAAVASGGNFRTVQNALTARALKQHLAAKAERSDANVKPG